MTSNRSPGFWDAHAHWSSPRLLPADRARWLHEAQASGIKGVILGGVAPSEWRVQQELYARAPQFFRMTWGLHPWTVSEGTEAELGEGLKDLEALLRGNHSGVAGLGELGLDHLPRFTEEMRARQLRAFELQLDLLLSLRSEGQKLAGVFHIVRAHPIALKVLESRRDQLPQEPWGIIHSFSGDPALARRYQRLGLIPSLSLGTSKRTVLELALGSFVLETDAPDQPPPGESVNHPSNLILLADRLAEWRGRGEKGSEILRESTRMIFKIFGL